MKFFKISVMAVSLIGLAISSLPVNLNAEDLPRPNTYLPTMADVMQHKAFYDDPRPYLTTFGPKQVLPPALYKKLSFDEETMKQAWAGLVGFRAPDRVGKIAPEIKPGKYSYKDKDKFPGLKALMWEDLYNRFNPGGPPHGGNIPEFEVVPTRQYYFALPIAEATKANLGKTQLDPQGYIVPETWISGYPFPNPSGNFKAQQVMYNIEKRYLAWGGNYYILSFVHGYTKDLRRDFNGLYDVTHIRLAGRVMADPLGWFDERAKERHEFKHFLFGFQDPRDVAGTVQSALYFTDPDKADQLMIYIPSLRRIRKMSATDTQDPIMGQDQIYDDTEGWSQKLSPERYPYKYEILEEREFLVPAPTLDGAEYISTEGLEFRNMKFERRPLYVIKLTQQDPNYVYGHRIFYVDQETFSFYHIENYDQKGRLYRTFDANYSFFPEMGATTWSGMLELMRDHVDKHSALFQSYQLPAFWSREDVNLKGLMQKAK